MANLQNKNNATSEARTESDNVLLSSYPVVLGSPDTSVTLDTDSVNSEFEDWTEQVAVSNHVLSPGSTVHVENSSDVVIGPLTQFHGPVTIYQNIKAETQKSVEKLPGICKSDVTLNKSTKPTAAEISIPEKHHTIAEILAKTSTKRLLIYTGIIFTTLITVILAIVLSLKMFTRVDSEGYTDSTTTPPLVEHNIYYKEDWGGKPALNTTRPLSHPTEYVVIAHTAGSFCKTFAECSAIVRQIQLMHVSQGNPDIRYNFLIGGDGSVYVGRGWDDTNANVKNTISISFVGNYVNDQLSSDMVSALEELLAIGVKSNKLKTDYKIVCHNQTAPTLSPGNNVYTKISQLSHFYSGHVSV